ncbi:cell division protein FtsH [Planctomyces sp. SCGC AG-212-M04]|nr:cell division protein FtsH [Planctomyces sp. SCGC AG-212-M04]
MSSAPPSGPKPPAATKPQSRTGEEREAEARRTGPPVPMVVLLISIILLGWLWSQAAAIGTRVDYSFFWDQLVKSDNVKDVKIVNTTITGTWKNAPENPDPESKSRMPKLTQEFNTEMPVVPEDRALWDELRKRNVKYDARTARPSVFVEAFAYSLPLLLVFGVIMWLMRRSSDPMSSGGMFGGFIRSPAKRFKPSDQKTTFDDVAGMENAKRELQEVVEFLKDPAKFQRLGAQIPKGVLLMGPPGTGKTLVARAVAGEAGVPFFSINGSEFIQMFVGVGASRVRDMFRAAKEASPCILFIDEIDAVGRIRGGGIGGGHDEREQTLNQILSEMDGFNQSEAVIVIAATNRPDVLDPALLRPGRFDRHVTIDRPTREGRLGILKVHVRKVPLSDDVDLERVAGSTIGFSGADLRNLVNEAALNATREGKTAVDRHDFEIAKDRIVMGAKREEILDDYEREMTAYHEAGHALIGWHTPEVDPVHKVTIVPRGRSLGVTEFQPEEDRYHIGERRLHAQLRIAMGGRAAEKLVFNEYSAGAEQDLKQATAIARRMVGRWGMSEAVGPVAFLEAEENPFLGRELHDQRHHSEKTAFTMDQEIQRFLSEAQESAIQLLRDHRGDLDKIAEALLKSEILDREALTLLVGPPKPRKYAPDKVVTISPDQPVHT